MIVRWRVDSGQVREPAVEALVEAEWRRRTAVGHALLFNGPLCRLISWTATAERLHLTLGPTDYRHFLGTNVAHLATIQARHPRDWPRYLADPLAVCTTLVSADGWLLVMRRSGQVAEYPAAFHVVGGHPTPAHDDGIGAISPTMALLEEINEETGLLIAEVTGLICLGLIRNRATHKPELVYTARLTLDRAAIERRLRDHPHRAEAAGWLWLNDDAAAIDAFLHRHADGVTPAGVAALTLYARRPRPSAR